MYMISNSNDVILFYTAYKTGSYGNTLEYLSVNDVTFCVKYTSAYK